MRISNSNTVLLIRPARDILGRPTGGTRPTPEFFPMTYQAVVDANPDILPYVYTPTYIDGVWANNDPPAVYLRFATEAEYEARVGKHLKPTP